MFFGENMFKVLQPPFEGFEYHPNARAIFVYVSPIKGVRIIIQDTSSDVEMNKKRYKEWTKIAKTLNGSTSFKEVSAALRNFIAIYEGFEAWKRQQDEANRCRSYYNRHSEPVDGYW